MDKSVSLPKELMPIVLPFEIGGRFYLRPRDDVKRRLFEKPDDCAHWHVLTRDKARRRTDAAGRLQIARQESRHRNIAFGIEQLDVQSKFLEKASFNGEIEMKKIKTLALDYR